MSGDIYMFGCDINLNHDMVLLVSIVLYDGEILLLAVGGVKVDVGSDFIVRALTRRH